MANGRSGARSRDLYRVRVGSVPPGDSDAETAWMPNRDVDCGGRHETHIGRGAFCRPYREICSKENVTASPGGDRTSQPSRWT